MNPEQHEDARVLFQRLHEAHTKSVGIVFTSTDVQTLVMVMFELREEAKR